MSGPKSLRTGAESQRKHRRAQVSASADNLAVPEFPPVDDEIWRDAILAWEHRLAEARAADDREEQRRTLDDLGLAYAQLRRWDDAESCFRQSLIMTRAVGNRHLEAHTLGRLGTVYTCQERVGDAVECFEQSVHILHALGDRAAEALMVSALRLSQAHEPRRPGTDGSSA